MKKLLMLGMFSLFLVGGLTANAESPRPSREDVMGSTPDTTNSVWVTGTSADGGAKGQSIAMTDFSYYSFRGWWDQSLQDVTKIRTWWKLDAANSGGSPRISLEVDLNGNGSVDDDYTVIYLDPAQCGDLMANGWTYSDFTGDVTNCTIYDSAGHAYTSDGTLSAWDKLVADPYYADAKVWFAYAIQDATTGTNYLDRVMLDSAFLTKNPA